MLTRSQTRARNHHHAHPPPPDSSLSSTPHQRELDAASRSSDEYYYSPPSSPPPSRLTAVASVRQLPCATNMSKSKRLKCANCNIVICEVLAFIQNKIDVMDEESLLRICESAFSVEDIELAKSLLFESLQKTVTIRKRQGKTQRNLDDIILLLKGTDPENIPTFVARNLEKLPPVTFDHIDVTSLLKKIVMMQGTIDEIREDYVSKNDINELMVDYRRSPSSEEKRNVNRRRSVYLQKKNISVMGSESEALPVHDYEENCSFLGQDIDGGSECLRQQHDTAITLARASPALIPSSEPTCKTTSASEIPCSLAQRHEQSTQPSNITTTLDKCKQTEAAGRILSYAEVASDGTEWKVPDGDDQWILVQKKRLRNRLTTKKGNAVVESQDNVKFKAADTKVPLFISNVHIDVCEEDIIDYVRKKTGETISLVKLKIKKQKSYNAYKAYVVKHKLDIFLEEKLWPSGISFRRFVNFWEQRNVKTVSESVANINEDLNGQRSN